MEINPMKNQPITNQIYDVLKAHGYFPTDSLITITLIARVITITPIKPYSSNLRNELITLIVKNGYSPNIKPNS
jgi:hypothetical protein